MRGKKLFSCLFSLLMISSSLCTAKPFQISSFKKLSREFKRANTNTLVVFNIDEVLITTKNHFIHPYSDKIFLSLIHEAVSKAKTEEGKKNIEEALSLSMLLPKRTLIEKDIPVLIKILQKKGVKVIALTTCPTGRFGIIPKVERWRINFLNELGMNFASSFPYMKAYPFSDIKSSGMDSPLFEDGILFCQGYDQGEVLKAFLKYAHFSPSTVIFIDDIAENLESVESALADLNIPFKGYQYNGAQRFFREPDEEILKYQLDYLIKNKEWLSDTEVQQYLSRKIK